MGELCVILCMCPTCRFIVVSTDSSETSEVWVLDLENPGQGLRCAVGIRTVIRPGSLLVSGALSLCFLQAGVHIDAARPDPCSLNSAHHSCVAARETGVLYQIDHRGDALFIVTNADGALDFKLCAAPLNAVLSAPAGKPAGRAAWAPVPGFPYDPLRKVDDVQCFKNFLAVFGREGGMTAFWVLSPADAAANEGKGGAGSWTVRKWKAPEEAYEVSGGEGRHPGAQHIVT